MRTTLELSWRLLRGGGRNGMVSAALTLVAVAISTGLLLLSAALLHGLTERIDRQAWREPVDAKNATAVQVVTADVVRGRSLTVVDLAARRPAPPVPPGMDHFPKPGEVWVSPALADLMKKLPADELARRFPATTPTGVLGRDAVVAADELVAVVGRAATDPAMTEVPGFGGSGTGPAPISEFARTSRGGYTLAWAAGFAVILVAVPLLVLMGAAARLSVARRDQRLAAMRLVGAAPRQVRAMTAAEAVLTAAVGAVAGALLYFLGIPPLSQLSMGGGTWFAGDLWVGWPLLLISLALVPVLVGISALIGLRRVVISPLGVVRRQTPPKLRALRIVFFLAPLGAAAALVTPQTALVLGLPLLALSFLGIPVLGPWVVQLLGRIAGKVARRPAPLLAARRLVDDPRSGWRTVSGIALTGFVAGFLAMFTGNLGALGDGDARQLELTAPQAQAKVVAAQVGDRLRRGGVRATVTLGEPENPEDGRPAARGILVAVSGGPADVDRARTALIGQVPGGAGAVRSEAGPDELLDYVRPAALLVLCVSFVIAATSACITAASSVLDRRQTYALLRLAGTPLKVLDKARRWETLLPVAVMGGGSIFTGMFMAALFNPAGLGGTGMVVLVACIVLGFAGITAASGLSRPLLRAITANPAPRPD